MLAHHARFLRVERTAFEEHAVGHGDLADVVQEPAAVECGKVCLVEAKRPAESRGVPRQPLAVSSRAGIARLDRRAQSQHHGFGRFELVSVTLEADERPHACAQLSLIVRLCNEIVASRFNAGQAIAPFGPCGDDDDGNEARGCPALQRTADLEAVTARRQEINQDKIWRFCPTGGERRLAGLNHANLTSLFREKPRQKARANLIIIGDEDVRTEHRGKPCKRKAREFSRTLRLVRFLLVSENNKEADRMRAILGAMAMAIVMAATTAGAADISQKAADRIREAATALREIHAIPDKDVPQELWDKAACVIVIPDLKKAAFIVGGEFGKGLMSCRRNSAWSAPIFMELQKGSWGLQVGAESVDLVLLVMNPSGVSKLLKNKVSLGADASVAAGPVGRSAHAATDAQLKSEILSWSRAQGLFAGIDISGGVMKPDTDENAALYGKNVAPEDVLLGGKVKAPAVTQPFMEALRR